MQTVEDLCSIHQSRLLELHLIVIINLHFDCFYESILLWLCVYAYK